MNTKDITIKHLRPIPSASINKIRKDTRQIIESGNFNDLRAHATINELRKLGVEPSAKGGITVAEYSDPEKNTTYRAYARCYSNEQFNRKIGKNVALGRLTRLVKGE
jgi:hypothetical protein